MKRVIALIILGCIVAAGQTAQAALPAPDWPSRDGNAANGNYNAFETTLTAKNVLKLKVAWPPVAISDRSYPVVAGNRLYVPFNARKTVHVRAIDIKTGRALATYNKGACGGILVANGDLYLAGHILQVLDATSGQKLAQVRPPPGTHGCAFVYPQWDQNFILAGYDGGSTSSVYVTDQKLTQVLRKLPSASASEAILSGHVYTRTSAGSAFYDETNGKVLAHPSYLGSDWFAGTQLAYTVSAFKHHKTKLYAIGDTGKRVWSRVVGPNLATAGSDWPHAMSDSVLAVKTLQPGQGVLALNPLTGHFMWKRKLANVQRLALANGLVFALTYNLGEPVHLVVLNAKTGSIIGGKVITLPLNYYAFNAENQLIVADGMVFLRLIGPSGPEVVALSP